MIGMLLRIYSYLFELLLAVFLLGLSLVSILSGSDLHLEMLPWKRTQLTYWLLSVALIGLLSILLAWLGRLRFLFLVYSLVIFGLLVRGYFLGGYSFSGKDEFHLALELTFGALLAIFGAWSQFRKKRRA